VGAYSTVKNCPSGVKSKQFFLSRRSLIDSWYCLQNNSKLEHKVVHAQLTIMEEGRRGGEGGVYI